MAEIKESVLPLYKKINDIQSDLFPLSLTAEFKVTLGLGYESGQTSENSLGSWLNACGVVNSSEDLGRYDFFASDVTLPGASFDMAESMGDRQGTIERFAQRRLYAPLQVTFYVDSDYNILRLFEEWMNYINPIHNESGRYKGSYQGPRGYEDRNNYYKFRYPDKYRKRIIVTKFEKDFYGGANMNETRIRDGDDLIPGSLLFYQFIDAFPSNIIAIPLSYQGTDVLKVQIEFQYLRYNVITNNNKDELYTTGLLGFTERTYDNSVVGQLGSTSAKTTTQPGFVNGELYTGPFHRHVRDDGSVVRMVGAAHVSYPHNVIYDTLEESLIASGITTTTTTESSSSQQQNNQQQQPDPDTTAPAAPENVSVTTASNDNTPTITGNAEAGSMVKLFTGSIELGSVTAGSNGTFSITVGSELGDGTYTFTVTATDSSGNVSNTTTISHTIDTSSSQQQNNQGQQNNNQQQNNQGGGGYPGY